MHIRIRIWRFCFILSFEFLARDEDEEITTPQPLGFTQRREP